MRTRNDLGAHGELLASAWLLGQGIDVFRNVSPSGPVDLVARDRDTGETISVDVKAITFSDADMARGRRYLNITHREPGIHYIVVVNGTVIGFCRHPIQPDRSDEIYWPFNQGQAA